MEYWTLVFTKSVDSNFRTFWLAPVTQNILGYSLFCEQREKWCVVLRKFQKKKLKKRFFYPSDLVNTKTTIPLRVGEERWIYTLTLCVSVYIHHYSPPLWGIVVYYFPAKAWHGKKADLVFYLWELCKLTCHLHLYQTFAGLENKEN